ncbi:HNH endonuclease [Streptomyces griseus]|uniref:HNH endonuclease n=1 Tax=Streptomyces griseus TaxID=1911 RepID=UPI00331D3C4E
MGNQLRIGEVLRSARNRDPAAVLIDGYPNIHHVTASHALAQIQLSKGVNPIAKAKAVDGHRRPAVLIRSSPWKAGTVETPWHDVFDLDNGHVRYYGDHRVDHTVPVGSTDGNAVLLETALHHQGATPEQRALAVPLLIFAAVTRNKTPKGYVQFCGLAIIENAEQIDQETDGRPFRNYRYDLAVLDLGEEGGGVDWSWIEARGNRDLSTAETLECAPHSWRRWVEHGHAALPEVRHRAVESEEDETTEPRTTTDAHEPMGLFPVPRQPRASISSSPGRTESSEELTPKLLMHRLRKLKVHQVNGRRSRHKPLSLLWGISRIAAGKHRLARWGEFRDEVGGLMVEFGHPESSVSPEYPFWHLHTSRLWDVRGITAEQAVKTQTATFDRLAPEAGMTEEAARLLDDPFVRSQAVAVLRETYLADVDQHALMGRLGLAGYESASGIGAPDGVEERVEEADPVERRDFTGSRIVRDIRLVRKVKRLHADRCQACGLQLATRFGTYSQGAHIRGLGHPHDGPDELQNLLVLCPNHHVQFDALAIYIDTHGIVRQTADGSSIGALRRHPAHHISEAHLRYHRALCGRDTVGSEPQDVASQA